MYRGTCRIGATCSSHVRPSICELCYLSLVNSRIAEFGGRGYLRMQLSQILMDMLLHVSILGGVHVAIPGTAAMARILA